MGDEIKLVALRGRWGTPREVKVHRASCRAIANAAVKPYNPTDWRAPRYYVLPCGICKPPLPLPQ